MFDVQEWALVVKRRESSHAIIIVNSVHIVPSNHVDCKMENN